MLHSRSRWLLASDKAVCAVRVLQPHAHIPLQLFVLNIDVVEHRIYRNVRRNKLSSLRISSFLNYEII